MNKNYEAIVQHARIMEARIVELENALDEANRLKAATLRATIENDYLDEIMED